MRGQAYAPQELIEFIYRKEFGLTQAELMDEPIDTFLMNIEIIGIRDKLEDEAIRRAERKAKR